MPDPIQLKLTIDPSPQTDDQELEHLAYQLRQEILELDVEDAVSLEGGPAPPRSKPGATITLGALLITTLASSGAIPPLLDLLKTWLTRQGLRSATLEIDGDKLELHGISAKEQKRLTDEWMSRHKLILTP